jgi:hypothetical protein
VLTYLRGEEYIIASRSQTGGENCTGMPIDMGQINRFQRDRKQCTLEGRTRRCRNAIAKGSISLSLGFQSC